MQYDFKQAKVLVIGDVMLDRYWTGDVDRISPEAPVPVVNVRYEKDSIGGAGNVAKNIASLGSNVTLVGLIGDDENGRTLTKLCRDSDINAKLLHSGSETTVKLRVISRHQQLIRLDFESRPRLDAVRENLDSVRDLISSHNVLILSDYNKGALSCVQELIKIANEFEVPVIVDPKGDDYQKYANAFIITPNKQELRTAAGDWSSEQELIQIAQKLRTELNLKYILLTRSEEGMTLFSESGAYNIKSQAREVFDVTGAGDTVVAVLASMLALNSPIELAVELSNKAGGIVVGRLGTATVSVDDLV